MSGVAAEAQPPDNMPAVQPPKAKRKIGYRLKMALLEVIERKRLSDRVDYKAICARHGCRADMLRGIYMKWTRGEIDLGDPTTPEEKVLDARMQHEKTRELLNRAHAMILVNFEGLLFQAEDMATNGDPKAYVKNGLMGTIKDLRVILELKKDVDKGYNAIIDEVAADRRREEKQVHGTPVTQEVETKVITANDEEKALAALGAHGG